MPHETIFGYLEDVNCPESWQTFLEEISDLREFQNFQKAGKCHSTKVNGKSLLQILIEYPTLKNESINNEKNKNNSQNSHTENLRTPSEVGHNSFAKRLESQTPPLNFGRDAEKPVDFAPERNSASEQEASYHTAMDSSLHIFHSVIQDTPASNSDVHQDGTNRSVNGADPNNVTANICSSGTNQVKTILLVPFGQNLVINNVQYPIIINPAPGIGLGAPGGETYISILPQPTGNPTVAASNPVVVPTVENPSANISLPTSLLSPGSEEMHNVLARTADDPVLSSFGAQNITMSEPQSPIMGMLLSSAEIIRKEGGHKSPHQSGGVRSSLLADGMTRGHGVRLPSVKEAGCIPSESPMRIQSKRKTSHWAEGEGKGQKSPRNLQPRRVPSTLN